MAPFLLLVIASAVAQNAFAQKQSSHPPRDLHRVGDHWTAYNPPDPSTYPAGAKTHTIKAGDTLWALAQQYYNNPYLWPQLWESNTWITDAHWIYPGDVLLVEGEGAAANANAAGEGQNALSTVTPRAAAAVEGGTAFTTQQGTGGGIPIAQIAQDSSPVALATESDIYCYGYIGDPNEAMPNWIESHEEVDIKYVPRMPWDKAASDAATGDLVYVHGGTSTGLVSGETYLIIEAGDLIRHPETGDVIGRRYDYVGQIRILCTEDGRSRAIITQACREVKIGTRLKPIPQLPIPIARVPQMAAWCDPPSGRTSGYIVDSRGWTLGLVEGTLVQINLGRDDQVEPGDFLTVFRPSEFPNQPRVVLGQLGVLTTEARTATAIIVSSRREMLVGDQVELR
ncbi:MAG TPA: LysM peptidoglycan-binding domain-containing protein [Thermoanaerobaculia bacterium]|nr:LysM peptidoglycan-binding domain-containing protein [Thermoanaerobaculia bacterium]